MSSLNSKCFTMVLLTLALIGVTAPPAPADVRVTPGQEVRFELTTTNRLAFDSSELHGRMVVLHFWAAVSEPSLEYLPELQRIDATYRPRGVAIVSVSVDPDPQLARALIQERALDWFQGLDAEQPEPLAHAFFSGPYGVPHVFLISPDGRLLWEGHPALLEAQLQTAVDQYPPTRDVPDRLGTPLTPDGPDAVDIAKRASEAIYSRPPDFRTLFDQVDLLPPEVVDQAKVKSFGRSIQRALDRLDEQQQEGYELYRSTYPDTAAALDQWMERSAASISEVSDDPSGQTVNPALVASRFKQAENAEAQGDPIAAYELYRWIVSRAPASDEAMLAQDVVMVLESDPDFMAELKAHREQTRAEQMLGVARNFTAANLHDNAEQTYRRVIAEYPDTDAAKEAAAALK